MTMKLDVVVLQGRGMMKELERYWKLISVSPTETVWVRRKRK